MQYEHLILLATTFASHARRSVSTVADWAGLHNRLFRRLTAGGGCRVDTFNNAMRWFDQNWPADLEWPQDVPRPTKVKWEAA